MAEFEQKIYEPYQVDEVRRNLRKDKADLAAVEDKLENVSCFYFEYFSKQI